jgi:hypothetical protein
MAAALFVLPGDKDVLKKQYAISGYNSSIPTDMFIQYTQSHDKKQRNIERLY